MKKLAVGLAVVALAFGCAESTPSDAEPPPPAAGNPDAEGTWTFESGRGPSGDVEPVRGHEITLQIEDGKARGSAGCNSYGGPVRVDGDEFDAGGFAVTEIGCPPRLAEPEERYLEAMSAAETILVEEDTLTLTGPDTELVFKRVPPIDTRPLTGTTWILESLVEGGTASSTVVSAERARLLLSRDGTFEGTTGCRSFSGAWTTAGDVVDVTELLFDGTCERGQEQDRHVAAVLGTGFRAEVEEDRLELTAEKGGFGLIYRAR